MEQSNISTLAWSILGLENGGDLASKRSVTGGRLAKRYLIILTFLCNGERMVKPSSEAFVS